MPNYSMNIASVCLLKEEQFVNFEIKSSCLDQFLGIFMNNPKFKDLWNVCKLVFVLFHGEMQTEQGFNVNKHMLVENLKERSLIGQRIVFNHMSFLVWKSTTLLSQMTLH